MTTRLALVGDRSPNVRSHARIPPLLAALRARDHLDLDAYWIPTDELDEETIAGFDGVWLLPGSPYRSEEGALTAVRVARERGIPFLGTCGGFQHALLEYARDVCGMTTAQHAENTPSSSDQLIVPLACSLAGHEAVVRVEPDSLAGRALGTTKTVERYFCAYGLDPSRAEALVEAGMRFTGWDDDGDVRVAELPGHPFFLATLFQPELAPDPHPLVRSFAVTAAGSPSS
ncbi:CTP synthase C-terminal region-related (seleno)protein [Phytohabitans houttuyneae]|uniref:CTP synthase (glutamine hydrolyzing) n=1 Tax=Phytohabitans houttuyneae TaxID=1076126 RepID=A0A6V8KBM5_9ACTN|nr:hypothetical protein [Phytohabitans houttuyneae]GFJ79117.1 CTP synthase [Phytohabitans houttuyneae]